MRRWSAALGPMWRVANGWRWGTRPSKAALDSRCAVCRRRHEPPTLARRCAMRSCWVAMFRVTAGHERRSVHDGVREANEAARESTSSPWPLGETVRDRAPGRSATNQRAPRTRRPPPDPPPNRRTASSPRPSPVAEPVGRFREPSSRSNDRGQRAEPSPKRVRPTPLANAEPDGFARPDAADCPLRRTRFPRVAEPDRVM